MLTRVKSAQLAAQVVAGAGAVGVGVWVIHHFLLPPVVRWWRGPDKPSPESAAALAVANALQQQVPTS